ncbi:MAG: GAF domain-containing protein [Thermogemmatispora sp.]|uniref:GAF domain-containing protein n=1 Tax=Thermogemmatispora sp. TaxID=1968838 RepID=UPI002611CFEB|nr:GAF domain-containing protein [Thermogemmatispora sp.]MBX5458018.1 GAF domain-containing protein [Thermogemmatispora sp.]
MQTWQELLSQLIRDIQLERRLAQEMGVQPITLRRWARGIVQPREDNLRRLLKAVPREVYPELMRLLANDFPKLLEQSTETSAPAVLPAPPVELYVRALSMYTTTPPSLYPEALYDLLLQQMLRQLDPEQRGLAVTVARCMPPPAPGGKVRSLREIVGRGNPPWPRDLSQQAIFLGAESLAGAAVTHCRLVTIPSRDEEYSLFAAHWVEHEQSAVACPILWQTRVAGCLIVSSTLPHAFTQAQQSLIERYAQLLSLCFRPEAFYSHSDIELRLMPLYTEQLPYLQNFRRYVSRKVEEACAAGRSLSLYEAQEFAWREIEEQLLELPLRQTKAETENR